MCRSVYIQRGCLIRETGDEVMEARVGSWGLREENITE